MELQSFLVLNNKDNSCTQLRKGAGGDPQRQGTAGPYLLSSQIALASISLVNKKNKSRNTNLFIYKPVPCIVTSLYSTRCTQKSLSADTIDISA